MIILRSKEFARKDYEGLTDAQKENLVKERSNIAKDLLKKEKKLIVS